MAQKSILIEAELHDRIRDASKKSGITIKNLTETAIKYYLKKIKLEEREDAIYIPKMEDD
jgi:hypothetical protein